MTNSKQYVGVDQDVYGGMTPTGKIVRDAWVFGLIPESETCAGWLSAGIEDLWRDVNLEWEKYGFLVGNLPEEMRARFMKIHDDAMDKARAAGWSGDAELAADT